MNTLHICHWLDLNHLKNGTGNIGIQDSLVIFGLKDEESMVQLSVYSQEFKFNWHLVINKGEPHIGDHCINHDQFVTLITQHRNTYAWK